MGYLTGALSEGIELAVIAAAKKDAATAIREGATAPWGDGETLPDVDDLLLSVGTGVPSAVRAAGLDPLNLSREVRMEIAACYDRFFRAEIDALAATTYTLRGEGGEEREITADSLEAAVEQAHEWAREGDYDLDEVGTIWVDTRIVAADGETVETVTTAIDPRAPKCSDGKRDSHDWQSPLEIVGGIAENPGVWGHGGGVVRNECCMRCGAAKISDSWAQRTDTGEQGLDSVRYEARKYADEIANGDEATADE